MKIKEKLQRKYINIGPSNILHTTLDCFYVGRSEVTKHKYIFNRPPKMRVCDECQRLAKRTKSNTG